jgi:hypothetical protein
VTHACVMCVKSATACVELLPSRLLQKCIFPFEKSLISRFGLYWFNASTFLNMFDMVHVAHFLNQPFMTFNPDPPHLCVSWWWSTSLVTFWTTMLCVLLSSLFLLDRFPVLAWQLLLTSFMPGLHFFDCMSLKQVLSYCL